MVIEKFASLPPWIDYQGVNFELKLIVNGRADDVRLCYDLQDAREDSPHYATVQDHGSWHNPFADGALQGFLYLQQGVETDEEFMQFADECEAWLKKNGLWDQ